jgi:hypothetical protein
MILDAGVFLLAERNPSRLAALLEELPLTQFVTNEAVMAQVWRNPARQVLLTRLLAELEVEVEPLSSGRAIGVVLGWSNTTDVVDASLAVTALSRGEPVLTSDPADLANLGAVTISL